ncbi:MAG: 2-keto-4-pentenoate hydratase [Deltaproteobacteria bacterium]|nr:MAG: 2-keto-4-pentenoate hydratase [Deltaproteobacteria bacterium]
MNDPIEFLAERLRLAEQRGVPCAPLRQGGGPPDLTVKQAYAIQERNIARRIQPERRVELLGRKVGLTSRAVQRQLGVQQPDFGTLLSDMEVREGGELHASELIQPRAEAEVAFVLERDLRTDRHRPDISTSDVIRATAYVLPAIEVIDSRIANWDITFEDTVADNASSARFVLGTRPVRLGDIPDLRLAGCALRKNGRVVSSGAGVACLDHPAHAVAWLANALAGFGTYLKEGQIVLSGALGPVTPLAAGDDLHAEIAHLGSVRLRCS